VTVLAIVNGSMIAGFSGWTTFIVDRSDRERKRMEEALRLRQEHLDRLLNAVEEPETEARLRIWSRRVSPEPCFYRVF
jgi:CheY-like chemotaxis protein